MVEERYVRMNIYCALDDASKIIKEEDDYLFKALEKLGVAAAQLAVLLPKYKNELRKIRNSFYELSFKRHCEELEDADKLDDEG